MFSDFSALSGRFGRLLSSAAAASSSFGLRSVRTSGSATAATAAGAVSMGANSYIGNAPNFMVKSIAEEQGVKMPSFFGYMLYSGGILLPLFAVVTFAFFR